MKTNEKYLEFGKHELNQYDKNHSDFRLEQFMKYLLLREKQFIANYTFEGDEDFDLRAQRTFLKLIFRYGNAGLINSNKYVFDNLEKDMQEVIDTLNIDISEIANSAMGNRIPVAVFPSHWNEYEKIVQGTGTTISRHNTGKKTYVINDKNTAIGSYDSWGYSGWYWWLIPAYQIASGDLAIKKRLSLTDVKLVSNKVNNTLSTEKYQNIYDMDESFINLTPAQKSMSGTLENEIDVNIMLSNKLTKLDFSNKETINDLMEFVKAHESHIFKRMGVRVNMQEGRVERSITKDFEADEVYWQRAEGELKAQMKLFCDEYKKVFGKEIKVVTLEDKVKEQLTEEEFKKAGRELEMKQTQGEQNATKDKPERN